MQIARMRNDGGVAMLNLLRRHLGASVEVSSYAMKEQVKVPEAYSTLAELEGVLRDNAQLCDRDDPTDWKRAIALGAPDLCLQFRDVSSAMRPFKLAMELLQEVIDPGQSMLMRYRLIPSIRDTVDAAVAAAIQNGDLVLALEWFEQGRCIIWGQLSRLRPPVEEIRDHSPKLADDMEAIIKEMSAEQPIAHAGREGAMTRHQELSRQYEKMVTEAQNIIGLGGYMKPKSMEELKAAVSRSHVVTLNVAWLRCDALILRRQSLDIVHVPLPQISPEVLRRLFEDLQDALNSADMYLRSALRRQWGDEGSLDPVLSQLWTTIVQPVLTALGCTEMPSEADFPRVTWCASGLLAFLPLHAAGPYSEGVCMARSPSALDLAIHSYVPSITSLLSATRVHPPTGNDAPPVFAVSQPTTPHQVPIPSTVTEVRAYRMLPEPME
ncbi:hypothetical protein CPB85DRAFT_1526314 [Mucidula mucida]|nr:hypothetical protein CPB85DRAFT_1526314 [Mucidula mucida]